MIEIQKNSREVIRISESEYEGHKFVDLRVWYNDNGEMKPTKKGISFNPSKAKEVVEGILSVVEKANWDSFND
jgi:hypothetical protein|tara:strand:- start:12550 stop:12768 length:219 start_codon:yes stop_codon:yes gene_type:complete